MLADQSSNDTYSLILLFGHFIVVALVVDEEVVVDVECCVRRRPFVVRALAIFVPNDDDT